MWRNAYTKSEEEKVALEAKVARLEEREKQLMEAEHEDLRSAAASQRNLRKRPANEPVKAPTCRNKKLRTSAYGKALSTQSSEAQTVVHSREDDEVDDEVDEGPERNNSQGSYSPQEDLRTGLT